MRPKEYYEQNPFQEDSRYVYALVSPKFKEQYKTYIKDPIEKIELDEGDVTCNNNIEFEHAVDKLDEIWKSIQKASIVVANITGFEPDVMFELGVAMMKKARVILIAEKSLNDKSKLPFDIDKLNVELYDSGKLDELSNWLVGQVEKWITPDEPKIKDPDVMKTMNDVLALRRDDKHSTALQLFKSMDAIEPGNWYIYLEWGITFRENKDYENACKKLKKAIDFTKSNSHKSEIYTELGITYRENNMMNEALLAFERAENLDRDNANLYEKWAFLYFTMGRFQDAMSKMIMAVKLNENNEEYKWKFEFYGKKFTDKNFRMKLGPWLAQKKEEKHTKVSQPERPNPDNQQIHRGPIFQDRNNEQDYLRFKRRHRIQEELDGTISKINSHLGIFVRLDSSITGLIHAKRLNRNFDANTMFKEGGKIRVKYIYFDDAKYQIGLDIAK